jgi:cyclic pyranopterin phosphate synthase
VRSPPETAAPLQRLQPLDELGRPLRELRVSVTDRCNFRCGYCMPRDVFHDGHRFMPREEILSFEEIERVVRIAVERLSVHKIRLTGGEPLLRRDLAQLVRMLAPIDGLRDLTLTTNGHLLAEHVGALADAGLGRITVSLDALDEPTFAAMSGTAPALRGGASASGKASSSVERVLAGIAAAERAGFQPIKINCVVIRGVNEHAVEALARRFRGTSQIVRFIEFMDVGTLNRWDPAQVVSADEIRERVERVAPLEPLAASHSGEVAERFRYCDGSGEVGIIASVTRPFCGACSRARLSADGRLLTCLFASSGFDLRALLRGGASDVALAAALATLWEQRSDRYSELRAEQRATDPRRRLEMYQIGG